MKIPGFLLRHTATVKPFVGSGAYGPQYGTPVTIKCYRDDKRRLVRASNGDEVVSEATFFCRLTESVPLESVVTFPGIATEFTVITVKPRDGGGLAAPDHLEVVLR